MYSDSLFGNQKTNPDFLTDYPDIQANFKPECLVCPGCLGWDDNRAYYGDGLATANRIGATSPSVYYYVGYAWPIYP
ncbi:unnamed protein product [Macrosiphum euphorbiae]|uniref:Uncharacterized protein n=1 Tax=Macrosiphum euphorbiae TaxID=13131 RepID=A0AAV0VXN0_9HEMI|nr:unnamed protein product [Macrosiphum euphorbiae]